MGEKSRVRMNESRDLSSVSGRERSWNQVVYTRPPIVTLRRKGRSFRKGEMSHSIPGFRSFFISVLLNSYHLKRSRPKKLV